MFSTGTPDGLVVIDIIIGLAFTFFTLSLAASLILESIASLLRSRARLLRKAIARLLDQETDIFGLPKRSSLADEVLAHPLISSLEAPVGNLRATLGVSTGPSYVPSHAFASSLLEVLCSRANVSPTIEGISESVSQLGDEGATGELKKLLNVHLRRAADLPDLERRLAAMFDDFMGRVTGWYKRYSQLALFVIGFCIAGSWDINTFEYAEKFGRDGVLRCLVLDQAAHAVEDETGAAPEYEPCKPSSHTESLGLPTQSSTPTQNKLEASQCQQSDSLVACREKVRKYLTQLSLVPPAASAVSSQDGGNALNYLVEILGWVVTALAISLGSQFWVGILQILFSLRSAGTVPASVNEPLTSPLIPGRTLPTEAPEFKRMQIEDLQNQLDMPELERTGELDLRTKSRIAAWQEAHGYPVSGELSLQTYEQIMLPEASQD